jgi:hypothetical protein
MNMATTLAVYASILQTVQSPFCVSRIKSAVGQPYRYDGRPAVG